MFIIKKRLEEDFYVPLFINKEVDTIVYPTEEEANIARISLQPEIDNLLVVAPEKQSTLFELKQQRFKRSIQDEILAMLDDEIETEINCNKMGLVVELAREVLYSVKNGIVNVASVTY